MITHTHVHFFQSPFSNLNDSEFVRVSDTDDNFNFTTHTNNEVQAPDKQLMYDRINNWINELNSKTLNDNVESNSMNCKYFTIEEFRDLSSDSNESFFILHLNIHSIELN